MRAEIQCVLEFQHNMLIIKLLGILTNLFMQENQGFMNIDNPIC